MFQKPRGATVLDYRQVHVWRNDPPLGVRTIERAQKWGGSRPYFICPGCEHPRVILYDVGSWLCQPCTGLEYPSTRGIMLKRYEERAEALRNTLAARRLGKL